MAGPSSSAWTGRRCSRPSAARSTARSHAVDMAALRQRRRGRDRADPRRASRAAARSTRSAAMRGRSPRIPRSACSGSPAPMTACSWRRCARSSPTPSSTSAMTRRSASARSGPATYMGGWLADEIARRRAAGETGDDMMGHLLRQGLVDDDGASPHARRNAGRKHRHHRDLRRQDPDARRGRPGAQGRNRGAISAISTGSTAGATRRCAAGRTIRS